jgi:DNA-directed RNA polymerase subunit RPC12/RpoP
MCGHVGLAGKLEFKDEALFRKLLIYDFFRGPDSTGAAAIRKNGDIKVAKVASHPLDLFDMKRYSSAITAGSSLALIGHNRLATKGKVNNENAHPYTYGHIVGAHNGTLSKASWDRLNAILGEETEVDSQAIFACIAKVGIDETIAALRASDEKGDCVDAWALVWADTEEGTLNFLRNEQRPFWYAYGKDFNRVMWASEWQFILTATQTGPVATQYDLYKTPENTRFWQTKANTLYQFDFDDLMKGYDDVPQPMQGEIAGKEVAPLVAGNFHGSSTTNQGGTSNTTHVHSMGPNTTLTGGSHGTTTTNTTNSPSTTSNILSLPSKKVNFGKQEVFELPGTARHPMGGYMSEDDFNKIAKYGCSWCQQDVEFNEVGVTVYENTETVLCPECSGNNPNSNRIYCSN